MMLGREAYATFPDKVAAFLFALLINSPFRGGNRRVALGSDEPRRRLPAAIACRSKTQPISRTSHTTS